MNVAIILSYRHWLFPVSSSSSDRNSISSSFRLVSFRYLFAWSPRPKMARFEIQEDTARMRTCGGGEQGSTKLWQVEDGRPPWRSASRHRCVPGIWYRVTRVVGA